MNITNLKAAGLTDGEIKIYLALLELGPSTTGPIVKKSGVARSIVYEILDKLMQKGLISFITKDKRKYFQAAEPNKILDYIDERERQLNENRKNVAQMLPQLLAMKESAKQSEAQIYEGFKGIQTVHEHTYLKLKRGEEYFYLGIAPVQEERYHAYWERDHVRRTKAGITCRLLFNRQTEPKILKNRNSYKGCDSRYMPASIETPAWIMGYKNVTAIGLQSKNGMVIEIVNQDIADSFKSYFEAFWKDTKPFKG